FLLLPPSPLSTLFPYTTLFRSGHIPFLGIIALPILFAAGMSLMDTADGAFMAKAYDWAFASPLRKVYYNMTTTGLSVFVALGVRSEEHTSELQSRENLVCRLLL